MSKDDVDCIASPNCEDEVDKSSEMSSNLAYVLDDNGLTPELAAAGYVDITPDKDGGVLKLVKQDGIGEDYPLADDQVTVHYIATLKNRMQYDDSRQRGKPFRFVIRKGTFTVSNRCYLSLIT